jgi:hypothetical protein
MVSAQAPVRAHPSIFQEFDHAEGFTDIWDLVLETLSSLIQVLVHEAILPALRSPLGPVLVLRRRVGEELKRRRRTRGRLGSCAGCLRWRRLVCRHRIRRRPCCWMRYEQTAAALMPLTMKGAFGMPLGFVSSAIL